MADAVVVTVLLHGARFIDTLAAQSCESVEVLTWDDSEWLAEAKAALPQSWVINGHESPKDALASARGEFIIEWNVYQADDDALASLVEAARAEADKRGSLSANWDPAILWRRDEFGPRTGRAGLAQARGVAIDAGSSVELVPPH